jgi:hypothetical protein
MGDKLIKEILAAYFEHRRFDLRSNVFGVGPSHLDFRHSTMNHEELMTWIKTQQSSLSGEKAGKENGY